MTTKEIGASTFYIIRVTRKYSKIYENKGRPTLEQMFHIFFTLPYIYFGNRDFVCLIFARQALLVFVKFLDLIIYIILLVFNETNNFPLFSFHFLIFLSIFRLKTF